MKRKLTLFLALFFVGIGFVMAQTQVRGTVVDEKGEPIIGANIRLKSDPQRGAASDFNGKFRISAPTNDKLVVSYVGYKTLEVGVKATLHIVLQPDAELLDDLVVVGYMPRSIAATSASVVKVDSKQLEEKPTANPFDAIQGKVTGLQVFTSSGEPSEISSVRLHGSGSLGAGSTPLYIVDGVPVSSATIRSMNPNDFESMQVLKDAAATSIYGARASNGVIYITTKKGKSGERAKITLRAQYGVTNLANTDYFETMMNSNELIDFWLKAGMKSQEAINAQREKYPHDTEWYKYYFKQDAPTYQADLAVSGGAGTTNYYISGSYFNQEGLRYRSGFTKYTLRANLNSTLNKYVKFGINNAVSYDERQTNQYDWNSTNGGLALLALPFYSPYDENGKEYYDEQIPGWGRFSPRYLADKMPYPSNSLRLNSAANITITPFKGLTLRSQAGLELADHRGTWIRYPSYVGALGNGGTYEYFNRMINWTFTNTAMYKFSVADDHNFAALLGHEFIDYHYDGFNAEGYGLEDDRLILLGATTKDKQVGADFTEYAFLSYFGQFSYDYLSKYYIDVTLRNDASSRFGVNNKKAMFWSLGTMWKAKNEDFLTDVSWLNDLNVKFSVGTTGNAAIGNYNALALVGKNNQYKEGTGWGIASPGNPNLTWEKQNKTTLGLDFRVLDRLSVNLELYNRLTSAMLMDVPYPFTSGFSEVKDNVGEYQNRGIDLKVDLDIYKNRAGDYFNAYFTYNYNQDKVKSLFQGLDHWIIPNTGVCYVVDQPVMFFYPLFKQVNPETGAPEWWLPGENIANTTKEEVTNHFTDGLDQNTGIKRFAPVNGGWGIDGSFKGFYLQAYFAFSLGKHLIVNDAFFFENPTQWGTGFNQRKIVSDFWQKPGDKTTFPSMKYRFTEFDSRMIQDASFMRMKTLTLGYMVPQNILKKQNFFNTAKVYFTGRNLLTFTKFEGPDPEIDSNLTLGANPNTKQIAFGFELSF